MIAIIMSRLLHSNRTGVSESDGVIEKLTVHIHSLYTLFVGRANERLGLLWFNLVLTTTIIWTVDIYRAK